MNSTFRQQYIEERQFQIYMACYFQASFLRTWKYDLCIHTYVLKYFLYLVILFNIFYCYNLAFVV
jgi:hypothetical protein